MLGSVVGFGCHLTLLGRIGADRVAYVNIVSPLIALGLSTLFEGFDWGWVAGAGLSLVLGGNVVAISYRRRPTDGLVRCHQDHQTAFQQMLPAR